MLSEDLKNCGISISFKCIDIAVNALPNPCFSAFEVIKRPEGYGIPGFISGSVRVSMSDIQAQGFSDSSSDLCEVKSISEALERLVLNYFTRENKITETSNGWASHTDPSSAIDNSIFELIERDVVLTNWHNGGVFYEIPETLWPEELINWKKSRPVELEFSDLKLFLTKNENGCAVSALLFNDNKNFIAAHSSRSELKQAMLSATSECMRAAHSALRFEYFADVLALHNKNCKSRTIDPGAHSLAYAYSVSLPNSIQFKSASDFEILKSWKWHQDNFKKLEINRFKIKLFKISDRYVARAKADFMQDIYWGQSPFEFKNNYPHFVG